MATFVKKNKSDILREALRKLETRTSIRATSAGTVARAFAEAITTELGDYYDALDFNLNQSLLSTATGRGLDLLGQLYNVPRKTVDQAIAASRNVGAFYFYLDAPSGTNIEIPSGTHVYTSVESFVGRQLGFTTVDTITIPAGRTRAYASLRPSFTSNLYSAAPGTLTTHDASTPAGVTLRCTNPKSISPSLGYEADDNYRIRIIKAIRVAASGTSDACRFAGLAVPGVRDIKIRQQPYGLGSFEVLVVSETGRASAGLLRSVDAMINLVRPVGVRMYVRQPTYVPADVSVLIYTNATEADAENLRVRAENATRRFFNELLPGEHVIYNRLIDTVLSVDDRILDMQITRFSFNGTPALRKNYQPDADHQVIPGRIAADYGRTQGIGS